MRRSISVLIAFLLIELLLALEHKFIFTLLKLPEMRLPYITMLSIFLLCTLVVFSFKKNISTFKALIIGIIFGQISGTASLTMANLFIKNGIQRNLASLNRDGFAEIFLTDATVAAILGGWLLGGIGFLAYSVLVKKFGRPQ